MTIACGSGDVEALKLLLADAKVEDVNRTDSVRAGGRRGLVGELTTGNGEWHDSGLRLHGWSVHDDGGNHPRRGR